MQGPKFLLPHKNLAQITQTRLDQITTSEQIIQKKHIQKQKIKIKISNHSNSQLIQLIT